MKKALVLLLYIILIALFVSCNPEVLDFSEQESLKDEHGIGNLMVSTEGNSSERTIQPESIERSCSSYQIFVKSTTGDYNEVYSTDQKALLIEGLDVDSYEVYVDGVNDLGINIVTSEKQIIVVNNQETTQAEFRLNKYTPGVGACAMEVRVPKNDNLVKGVKWVITSRSDNESFEYIVDDYHFSLDSSYRCYLINGYIESGNYDIQVIMLDGDSNQVGFTYLDSLHVFKESTSSSVLIWDKEFFPAVPTPFFDVADGTYSEGKIVRIRCNDERAEIYYTTDGSNPSSSSTLYVNPLRLDQNTEVRAVAVIDGLMDSEIAIGSYKIKVDNPVFNIKDQSVVNYDYLTISTSTSGATILYTLDGSTPTEDNGLVYSEPIRITRSLTVKAIATKDKHDSSTVVSAEYYDVNSPSPDRFFSVSDSGEVSVNEAYRNTLPSVVVIPAKIGQTSITAIANAGFIDCTRLKTLVIPNSIVKIGASAFLGCSNIESIDISSYVTEINQSAFSGWTINQSINDYSGLIKAGSLVGCNAKIYATIKTGTAVVSGYTGMENLYGINLPNSITEIAANAFSGCINLAELTIPDYVVTIGQYAFNNCTSLQTITLPSILTYLSYDAFRGWTSNQVIKDNSGLIALNKLINSNAKVYTTIPNNIYAIPASIGENRSDVYGLTIPDTVTSIGDYAFCGTNIESITIPETVESIGLEVFKGWTDDQIVNIVYNGYSVSVSDDATSFTNNNAVFNVSFSDNISAIDDDAFNGMAGLESITIPSSVTSIGDSVFKNTSISGVGIPNNMTSLGSYCFFNCDNLTAIELPDSVTSIGDYCFADCSKITTVNLGSGITSIPSHVFDNCALLTNVVSPNCRGSFLVTVKVPVRQLSVYQIDISVNPTYATALSGYSTTLYRSSQLIEGDWRVFTYEVPDMLAIDYTVSIILRNADGDVVGSYVSDSEAVTAGNQSSVARDFYLSEFNNEPKVSIPTFNPTEGTCLDGQLLTLSCPGSDAIIYTTDGTTPTEFNGIVYSYPLSLNQNITIKAVGIKEGYRYSDVVTKQYNVKVNAPVFSVEAGHTYQSYQTVELISGTSGVTIRYTLDGTKPNNYSAVYTEPIVITQSCTLKAIAFKDGLVQSDVTSGHYTITLPDSAVVTPTVYELVVKDSNNHIISEELTGETVLNVSLSPSVNDNLWTCTWSLDGKNVSDSKSLSISGVGIIDGYHILQLTAIYDDKPYSKQIVFRYQQEAN